MEGVDIDSEEVPEPLSQTLEALRQYLVADEDAGVTLSSSDVPLAKAVCNELLVRVSLAPKAFTALNDAAVIMVAAGADDKALQVLFTVF